MDKKWIKNYEELATTENRKLVLDIIDEGLNSICTENVIQNSIKLENNFLFVNDQSFDLSKFNNIKVVGFGKASCQAAQSLEKVLGDRIKVGAVIGLTKVNCEYIETFAGTHPRPSVANIEAGEKIYKIANESKEDDLIIAIVSGGGSALLCSSNEECTDGIKLYDEFLKSGKTTIEMNTIRKHISVLKGGGLAKAAYPATVIGLVFSDLPGEHFENVASGPTYKDESSVSDAQSIIDTNNLGKFNLIETPKDDKYFEKTHNFVLVSNETAVSAMSKKARDLGFMTEVFSTELYDQTEEALHKIFNEESNNTVVLSAGEPKLIVRKKGGSGGRNLYMSLEDIKLKMIDNNSVFISLASDGMDNSDAAGAIVDHQTLLNIENLNIDVDDYLERFDAYPVFKKSGDMIITGPTGANVSDLMILLTRK